MPVHAVGRRCAPGMVLDVGALDREGQLAGSAARGIQDPPGVVQEGFAVALGQQLERAVLVVVEPDEERDITGVLLRALRDVVDERHGAGARGHGRGNALDVFDHRVSVAIALISMDALGQTPRARRGRQRTGALGGTGHARDATELRRTPSQLQTANGPGSPSGPRGHVLHCVNDRCRVGVSIGPRQDAMNQTDGASMFDNGRAGQDRAPHDAPHDKRGGLSVDELVPVMRAHGGDYARLVRQRRPGSRANGSGWQLYADASAKPAGHNLEIHQILTDTSVAAQHRSINKALRAYASSKRRHVEGPLTTAFLDCMIDRVDQFPLGTLPVNPWMSQHRVHSAFTRTRDGRPYDRQRDSGSLRFRPLRGARARANDGMASDRHLRSWRAGRFLAR